MKIATAFACLMLAVLNSFGQTTEEEFNYITKGYKIQLESGLDMKKGYRFEEMGEYGLQYDSFSRLASFNALYRDGETTPCAILMILRRTDTNYKEYLCIPSTDADPALWTRALREFEASANDWTPASRGYAWGMVQMLSNATTSK